MIRGKGLTQQTINHAENMKGNLMTLYASFYESNEEIFDLTSGQPSFDMKKDFTVATRRNIKSKYAKK